MLMLTRSIGQKVRIGNDISITILDVQGMQVRLGIDAPKYIEVYREEIYRRISSERARQKTIAILEKELDKAIGNG